MGLDREQLNRISVASPCAEPWDRMRGDDQVRHCDRCEKNVYNLSVMKLEDIAELVEKKEGKMCVRFFRRTDGTILTEDCPVGLKARVRRRMALAVAFIGSLWGVAAWNFAWISAKLTGKPLPGKSWCGSDDRGQWVAGGIRPMPPALPPVNFKVKGIAGTPEKYVGSIEWELHTYTVTAGSRLPDAKQPEFEVKQVTADAVVVFDFKTQRLVKKQLVSE